MNMDKPVIMTSETTSAVRQSVPDPVLHSMHAIAWQQYEFEQSLLNQQLWSQQQAVSMEMSIKAVALQAAAQANDISHILRGRNDVSKEEVVKEIQSDRVIEELKSSWKTSSWHSSASRLMSGSTMGLNNDQKEEETRPAEGLTSERNHKNDHLDYKDTHQGSHGYEDWRNCSSDYRSHRPHRYERSRSRSRVRGGVRKRSRSRSRIRSGVRNRNSSRTRCRYLSRSPPSKYKEGRSRSRVRGGVRKRSRSRSRVRSGVRNRNSSRTRSSYLSRSPPSKYKEGRSRSRARTGSRYRSRSPPKTHSGYEYYSHGPEDLKPKSTHRQQETRCTSSGGQTKSDNSPGDICVQTHSATPWNCSSEQEKKDLSTDWPRWKE